MLTVRIQHAARVLLLAVMFLPAIVSCSRAGTQNDLLAYQSAPFQAALRGEMNGFIFAGELSHSPDEGSDHWVFTDPPALRGIEMSLCGEEITVTYRGITVTDERWDDLRWAEIPALFSLEGEPISFTADREQRQTTAIFQTHNGKAYTVTFDSDTALPREIEGDGIRVEILAFQP